MDVNLIEQKGETQEEKTVKFDKAAIDYFNLLALHRTISSAAKENFFFSNESVLFTV